MVRVYFHLKNGQEEIRDREGVEVSDLEEARAQALRAIEDLLEENPSASQDWSGWTLDGADGSGAVLLAINLDSRRIS